MGALASLRFVLGAVVGLAAAVPVFLIALIGRRRAFHREGLVYRAEVTALDGAVGPRLAGPAVARLSGAMEREGSPAQDILGLAVRLRRPGAAAGDLGAGDQDLALGTFESFREAAAARARTRQDDYLANEYASVTPWRVRGVGLAHLRALPPPAADPDRAPDRAGRLDADVAAGRARFTVLLARDGAAAPVPIAEVRLLERLPVPGHALRISMFRTGRGLSPTGFRNGIRAIAYPASQLGRWMTGR